MPKETEKCNNDCENCEYYEDWDDCDDITEEELNFDVLADFIAGMDLHEFAPMMRGTISMYAAMNGISVGKVLDAMLLEKYSDEDLHWDAEQECRGMTS